MKETCDHTHSFHFISISPYFHCFHGSKRNSRHNYQLHFALRILKQKPTMTDETDTWRVILTQMKLKNTRGGNKHITDSVIGIITKVKIVELHSHTPYSDGNGGGSLTRRGLHPWPCSANSRRILWRSLWRGWRCRICGSGHSRPGRNRVGGALWSSGTSRRRRRRGQPRIHRGRRSPRWLRIRGWRLEPRRGLRRWWEAWKRWGRERRLWGWGPPGGERRRRLREGWGCRPGGQRWGPGLGAFGGTRRRGRVFGPGLGPGLDIGPPCLKVWMCLCEREMGVIEGKER